MPTAIIYPAADGTLAVLIPAPHLPPHEVARKDVPAGVPYRLVDAASLPEDRTWRAAWTADFSRPDGHGADYGAGTDWQVIAWTRHGRPALAQRLDPATGAVAQLRDLGGEAVA